MMKKMTRKIGRIVLVLVLALILMGVINPASGQPLFGYITEAAETQISIAQNEEEFVALLRAALVRREANVKIALAGGTLAAGQAMELAHKAEEHTGVPTEGDYIAFHVRTIRASSSTETIDSVKYPCINYRFTYSTTAAQEAEMDTAVQSLLEELNLDGLSDYEKIMQIYDYLSPLIEYDYSFLNISYTAYGALVNHRATCEGYSLLFYRLMLELGIDCRLISGYAIVSGENEGHGWNIVKLGDVYYNVDLTGDSGKGVRGRYDYCLRNNEEFPNHFADDEYLTEEFLSQYPIAATSYTIEPKILVHPEDCIVQFNTKAYLKGKVRLDSNRATFGWELRDAGTEEWVAQPGISYPDIDANAAVLCGREEDGDQYRLVIRDRDGNLLEATDPVTIYVIPYYQAQEWIWAEDNSSADVILKSTVSDTTLRYTCPVEIIVDEATCSEEGGEYYYAHVKWSTLQFFEDRKLIRTLPIQDHSYQPDLIEQVTENGEEVAKFHFYCKWCGDEIIVPVVMEQQIISKGATCGDLTERKGVAILDAASSPDHEEHVYEADTSYYEPHRYGEPVWSWNEDCTYAEARFTCLDNPEHVGDYGYMRIDEETVEADCHTEGTKTYTATVLCQGKEYSDQKVLPIPKTNHTWNDTYTIDKEATCKEEGSQSIHCSICGDIKPGSAVAIPKSDHVYGDWVVTKEAGCEEAGLKEQKCSACGKTVTEVVQAKGHLAGEASIENKVEATCETDGSYEEVICCSACGKELSRETKTIGAPGHQWNEEYTIVKEATCKEEGSKEIRCSVCGAIKEGSTEVIPKIAHAWGDWEVTKAVSFLEDGEETRTCSVCGETENRPIRATGKLFNDVKDPSAWYYDPVYLIAGTTNNKGVPLMSGYADGSGNFGPADPLARQDFAVILFRLADEPRVPPIRDPFPDADPKGYYYNAVLWAKGNSIITGYNDGRFGVGDKITREQVATILYRFAKDFLKHDTSKALAAGDLSKYEDQGAVSGWASEALTWATGAGVITGKANGTRVDPVGNAARAEIGTMILRFIDYITLSSPE